MRVAYVCIETVYNGIQVTYKEGIMWHTLQNIILLICFTLDLRYSMVVMFTDNIDEFYIN